MHDGINVLLLAGLAHEAGATLKSIRACVEITRPVAQRPPGRAG